MGVISRKEQRKENKKQREWQSKENQLSRDHNLMLAELQNKWNKEQWDRENAYNSPSQQMQRFKDAGLNPNLIYGQTNTSAQLSGSLTAGQGYSPQDFSSSFDHGIADRAVGQGGNMIKSAAQLGDSLMQIPAYKEQVESMKLDNQQKRLNLYEQKTTQKSRFEGIDLNNSRIRSEIRELDNKASTYEPLIAKMREETALIGEQKRHEALKQVLEDKQVQAEIRRLAVQNNNDTKLAESQIKYMAAQMLGIESSIEMSDKQAKIYDIEAEQMKFQFDEGKNYYHFEKQLNQYEHFMQSISPVSGAIQRILGIANRFTKFD